MRYSCLEQHLYDKGKDAGVFLTSFLKALLRKYGDGGVIKVGDFYRIHFI